MDSLPREVLDVIVRKLPTRDAARFECTSRSTRDASRRACTVADVVLPGATFLPGHQEKEKNVYGSAAEWVARRARRLTQLRLVGTLGAWEVAWRIHGSHTIAEDLEWCELENVGRTICPLHLSCLEDVLPFAPNLKHLTISANTHVRLGRSVGRAQVQSLHVSTPYFDLLSDDPMLWAMMRLEHLHVRAMRCDLRGLHLADSLRFLRITAQSLDVVHGPLCLDSLEALEVYELDPARIATASFYTWPGCIKDWKCLDHISVAGGRWTGWHNLPDALRSLHMLDVLPIVPEEFHLPPRLEVLTLFGTSVPAESLQTSHVNTLSLVTSDNSALVYGTGSVVIPPSVNVLLISTNVLGCIRGPAPNVKCCYVVVEGAEPVAEDRLRGAFPSATLLRTKMDESFLFT